MDEKTNETMTPKDQYEQIYREDPTAFGREPHRVILELEKRLSPESTILDLGAGQGRNALYLARRGYRVTAIELTETGCQQMQTTAKEQGLSLDAFIQGDISDASVLSQFGIYDAIICVGVIPFLNQRAVERVLAAMQEKTNARGHIAISGFMELDIEKRKIHLAMERYRFSPGELRERFADWEIHFYEEVLSTGVRDHKQRYSARIAAQKN